MKTLDEKRSMLVNEFCQYISRVPEAGDLDYYNEAMGDVSFIIASVLESELEEMHDSWISEKWIDDSLISKVKKGENSICIWGIMIWGREKTTEQWTDPFYFEIWLNFETCRFLEYTFLFGEVNMEEVTYEEFNTNRMRYDVSFYSSDDWHPSERNWRYIRHFKNNNLEHPETIVM